MIDFKVKAIRDLKKALEKLDQATEEISGYYGPELDAIMDSILQNLNSQYEGIEIIVKKLEQE
jgi:hypothetical protein